jgi:Tetratricopeptide repeat
VLAGSYHDAARREEALKMMEEVLVLRRKVLGNDHAQVAASLGSLGEYARARGDFPTAEAHLLEGWQIAKPPRSGQADLQREILDNLVQLYGAWSKTDATKSTAVAEWKEKLAGFDQAHPELKPRQP